MLALLGVGAAASAQDAPHPQGEQVTIKVDTQLVVETVVVKGKGGNNLDGLTANDFTITEDGVPQTISIFQYQQLDDTRAVTPITTLPSRISSSARLVTPGGLSPSRSGEARYSDRRLLILLFDLTAMPPSDQSRSCRAAEKFILTQMKSPDLLAIMIIDAKGAVRVLRDFTDDRSQLLDVLQRLRYPSDNGNNTGDPSTAFGQQNEDFNIFNTDRKLAALHTAVNMLGAVEGQKALVYFVSGLYLNGTYNQAQVSATINAAIRANVAFFPVDARGLVASAPLGDARERSPGGIGMYSGAASLSSIAALQSSQDPLFTLAGDTGGKALLNNNDLAVGIVQAEQTITSYYIIGYYPLNSTLDGKFRRVKVGLKQPLTATLAFRQGYFAAKTFDKFTASDRERQLEDALMLGDPITDLAIELEVNYFRSARMEYVVPITVRIPGSEVVPRRGGSESAVIDFIGEVKAGDGTTIQNVRDKVQVRLKARPIQYDAAFTLLPGAYVIKVLARNGETGRIGTYQASFIIPNLTSEEKRIPISSVVLSSQRVELKKALYATTRGRSSSQAADPLVVDGQKLMPSVTRVFSESRTMYVYLQAYQPDVTITVPLVAFVTFYRGQTRMFETSPLRFVEGWNPVSKALPLKFSLSLSKLPLGEYDCQVTILDPTRQRVAFWQAAIMLVP